VQVIGIVQVQVAVIVFHHCQQQLKYQQDYISTDIGQARTIVTKPPNFVAKTYPATSCISKIPRNLLVTSAPGILPQAMLLSPS
jgi:hypothetical protein